MNFRDKPVMMVEDNELNARLIRKILEAAGYNMVDYRNAEDALNSMDDVAPGLILLDLQLPGMSGYEFAQTVRNNPDYNSTKIIAISANVRDENKRHAEESGCDGFIEKPINTRTFVNDISMSLEKV
jgi:CheY-like chemotaxis protein